MWEQRLPVRAGRKSNEMTKTSPTQDREGNGPGTNLLQFVSLERVSSSHEESGRRRLVNHETRVSHAIREVLSNRLSTPSLCASNPLVSAYNSRNYLLCGDAHRCIS